MRISDWSSECAVPAGRADAGRVGPVLQEFRPHRRHLGVDEPCGRAPRDADDRRLFPKIVRPRQARRRLDDGRSEEHTSELQSLMRISYAVFCLKKNTHKNYHTWNDNNTS